MLCLFQVHSKVVHVHMCIYIYIYIYIFIFSESFPIWVIIKYWVEFPVLYRRSLLVIYPIYCSMCVLILSSWFIPSHSVPPLVTISLFSPTVSLFLFSKYIHFLSLFKVRFYLHVTSYDICLSLNDSLCLEWSFLDPSMLLQMAFFLSFCGWVTFHCVSIPHRIYPFLCWWTFRLSLCLACCKLCCNERYIHLF